jgi:naphthoate synthase
MVGRNSPRIWYLCRQYTAGEAYDMGLVNKVVPAEQLAEGTKAWCRECCRKVHQPCVPGIPSTRIPNTSTAKAIARHVAFYTTEESKEGRRAFIESQPDFSKYRQHPW